jgi:hypothetical protein
MTRLHRLWQAAALVFAATAGGPAQARDLSPADEARSTLRATIKCAVDDNTFYRRGAGVIDVLEGGSDSEAFGRLYVNIRSCLARNHHDDRGVSLQFPRDVLKGQIYRAIVLDGWGIERRRDLMPQLQRIADLEREAATNPLGTFGVCVARLDPDNARLAIGSMTAGDDEAAAYAALAPALSQCVSPGTQIRFSKQILEGALSEGLFVTTYSSRSDVAMQGAR